MFSNNRYHTRGFNSTIPVDTQRSLWLLIESLRYKNIEMDYLQIFNMKSVVRNGKSYQVIEHSQEVPEYKFILGIECHNPVDEKVFIISTDDISVLGGEYGTAMLAYEY